MLPLKVIKLESDKCRFEHPRCRTRYRGVRLVRGNIKLVEWVQFRPLDINCVKLGRQKFRTHPQFIKREKYTLGITSVLKGKLIFHFKDKKVAVKRRYYLISLPFWYVPGSPSVGTDDISMPNLIEYIRFFQPMLREIREKQGLPKIYGSYDFDFHPRAVPLWYKRWRNEFIKEIFEEKFPDPLLFEIMVLEFYHRILLTHPNSLLKKMQEYKQEKSDIDDRIQKAMEYIETHFQEQISIKDLSTASMMSGPHFFRVFKKQVGKSPMEYLQHYRVQKAIKQLQETRNTIESIAYNVGYTDSSPLWRAFLKVTGKSPSSYRPR